MQSLLRILNDQPGIRSPFLSYEPWFQSAFNPWSTGTREPSAPRFSSQSQQPLVLQVGWMCSRHGPARPDSKHLHLKDFKAVSLAVHQYFLSGILEFCKTCVKSHTLGNTADKGYCSSYIEILKVHKCSSDAQKAHLLDIYIWK